MEQELKKLGLNKCLSKKTIDKLNNIDEELKNNKDLTLNDSFNLIEVEEKPSSSSIVPQQQKFKSNARRMSSIGIMTTAKSNDEFANIKKIRKFSLDQHQQSVTSGKSNLIKSYRRLSMANDTLLKPFNNETNKALIPQQQPARISPSSLFAPSSSVKTDSSDQHTNLYTAAGSIYSTSRNRSSISSYSSVNLPKLSRLSLSRSISSVINNTNTNNTSNNNNTNTNKSNKEVESKRRVSFCQIDLNQLDNPKLYRYTNTAAYDRFKFNPHYYLPDGTLKRKFSLPKLSDTLEAVKNCNYLRRKSIDNIADQLEVINIFKNSHNNNNNNSNSTAATTPTRDLNFNNNTSIYVSQLD